MENFMDYNKTPENSDCTHEWSIAPRSLQKYHPSFLSGK